MVRDILTYIRENYKNKVENDPGFGFAAQDKSVRFLNANGQPNVIRTGIPLQERIDVFHLMLNLSWAEFFILVLLAFIGVNLSFAGLYWVIGAEELTGLISKTKSELFWEIFYFSAQTLTTVGYGRISPIGHTASALASLESLMGLLGFALFTGLIYGRFAKPTSALMYSKMALVAPYRGITGFMFRIANAKTTELMEAEVLVILTMIDFEQQRRTYIGLELERSKIMFLSLNWTIVHPIDEKSPLIGLTHQDLIKRDAEFLIVIKAFDETRAQTIYSRSSYKATDMIWGAKFSPLKISVNENGTTIHDVSTINDYIAADLPY